MLAMQQKCSNTNEQAAFHLQTSKMPPAVRFICRISCRCRTMYKALKHHPTCTIVPYHAHIAVRLLLLLVRESTLPVWALRVALGTTISVLLRAVDLLRLCILTWLSTCRLVANWRKLGTTHLRCHHVRLSILTWLALGLRRILAGSRGFLSHTLFLCFPVVLLFLFLSLPLLSNFLKLCVTGSSVKISKNCMAHAGQSQELGKLVSCSQTK